MIKSRRFWLGFSVSLVFMVLFFFRIDVGEVVDAMKGANYLGLIPAILAYFMAMFFRTMRWRYVLSPLRNITPKRLWPVLIVGYTANNLLPVRLGELVRVHYLREREPVSRTSALATILVERVFDGLVLLFFAAAVSLTLPVGDLVKSLADDSGVPWLLFALSATVPFVAIFSLLVLVSTKPGWLETYALRLLKLVPAKFRPAVQRFGGLFVDGLVILQDRRRLLAIFIMSLPVWLLEALMYYFIALSFGLQDLFSGQVELVAAMLLVTATSNLGTSIPSSQGGVGPFEFFGAATLVLLGIERSLASAYILVLHVALLGPVTVLGLFYLWWNNISLRSLTKQKESVSSEPVPMSTVIPLKADDIK